MGAYVSMGSLEPMCGLSNRPIPDPTFHTPLISRVNEMSLFQVVTELLEIDENVGVVNI